MLSEFHRALPRRRSLRQKDRSPLLSSNWSTRGELRAAVVREAWALGSDALGSCENAPPHLPRGDGWMDIVASKGAWHINTIELGVVVVKVYNPQFANVAVSDGLEQRGFIATRYLRHDLDCVVSLCNNW